MKRFLLIVILSIAYCINTSAQNFVFIGENSYPCTENYILISNSDEENISNLMVVFAKDGTTPLIVLSSKLSNAVKIAKKLIIYLDDGNVISCVDKGINDNVDDIATTAYYLTHEEVNKIKNSNINTVRYEIVCPACGPLNAWEGNYSASNKGSTKTDFTEVIAKFYND